MEIYKQSVVQYQKALDSLKKKYNLISFFRFLSLLAFLVLGYIYFISAQPIYIILALFALIIFVYFLKLHDKNKYLIHVNNALVTINQDEILYLNRIKIPFENGIEFNDFNHLYCYDLDIFGENSLFQNVNRTATFIGKKKLSQQLLTLLPNDAIIKNQTAIEELAMKLSWRHYFLATSKITKDDKSVYETLLKWSRSEAKVVSNYYVTISFVSPILLIGCVIAFFITKKVLILSIISA